MTPEQVRDMAAIIRQIDGYDGDCIAVYRLTRMWRAEMDRRIKAEQDRDAARMALLRLRWSARWLHIYHLAAAVLVTMGAAYGLALIYRAIYGA